VATLTATPTTLFTKPKPLVSPMPMLSSSRPFGSRPANLLLAPQPMLGEIPARTRLLSWLKLSTCLLYLTTPLKQLRLRK